MNTENVGAQLHGDDEEARRQAASLMGSARTERKIATSRANAARATEARRGKPMSEEHKAKLRAAYQARREREQVEQAAGTPEEPKEKRPVGRPRTRPIEESAEKRPRGRPKKRKDEESQ